ncbi:MAG: long-chain fatty acid--CoA ligase [Bacillaceae bacterium]
MENVMNWFSKYEGDTCSHEIDIPLISLPDILMENAKTYKDQYAVSMYGHKLTYQQLAQYATAFAIALQKQGVKKGDPVGLMLPNCPQYVIAYYGTLLAGGIVTQINPMLMERELIHILNDSGCDMVVTLDGLYDRVQAMKSVTNLQTIIVVSFTDEPSLTLPDVTFTSFLQSADKALIPVSIQPKSDVAVLQYTGGTTGLSKGAMLTHYNLVANLVQMTTFFQDEMQYGKEKIFSIIPLFHVMGMTTCMNWAIYGGQEMVILPRFDLEEALQTIKKEKPTIFPGVPTIYVALTNHPKAQEYGIDSIRFCFSGSAPMPVELMKEFEKKTGGKVYEGYGLSETAPVTHCNPPSGNRKPGSVGLGMPQTAYKIVDVATGQQECPVGELGEVIVKGPQVMLGYWNNPEETAHTLRDGWLYTGDIGRVDDEGYLYIVDRKKDLIIAGGFNIYPRDIEEVLYEHPAVLEAVVIGVPDAYRGETVKAIIVPKENKQLTEKEILAYCKQHLAAYKLPKIIEFRTSLPKTNVGKILRRALREEEANK